MADSSIPMGFKFPEIDTPYDAQRRQLGLQGMAQAVELNKAKIDEERIKAQQAATDQRAQSDIQKAFIDNAGDYDKTRKAILGKVPMKHIQSFDNDHLTNARAILQLTNEQRTQADLNNKLTGQEAAGLLQLPYEQRTAALPGALARLQQNGIDTKDFGSFDPTDDNLKSLAAHSGYLGQIITNADRQAQEVQRKEAAERAKQQGIAIADKDSAEQKQRKREDVARLYLALNPQSPEEHLAALDEIDKRYPDIAPEYGSLKFDPAKTPGIVQDMALSAKDRTTAGQRSQAEQDRAQYQQDSLDLRKQIADQNTALRRELSENKTGRGSNLTPGQFNTEERNINAVENGTANRPGLNAQRRKLGTMLKDGVDEKGVKIEDPAVRDRIQSQMDAVNDNLQQTQFRKAKLYGIQPPDMESIDAAKDGQEIPASDGSVWKKSYGVAFFAGRGGGTQAPAAPAIPPPAAQPATPKTTAPAAPALHPDNAKQLKDGIVTKFADGSAWTLLNGNPTKMQKVNNQWTAAR